jgi:hypothetical protein
VKYILVNLFWQKFDQERRPNSNTKKCTTYKIRSLLKNVSRVYDNLLKIIVAYTFIFFL